MHIVYVSDGKAGHRSQAVGLYKAMQRISNIEVTFQEISIQQLPVFTLLKGMLSHQLALFERKPDYIFGVGSHTQSRVLLLGRVYPQAKTVILMKPNFPFAWFDHAIIPEHDGVPESTHVITTQGALNPIVNEQRHQANRILVALGGSSKRHQWNEKKVLEAIQNIVQHHPQAEIILTTSRRTPKEFLGHLSAQPYASQLQIFPVEDTPQGWIFEQMQQAEAVWVTEDSVSMIFEALTAGCKVGIIAIDRLKSDRITTLLDQLLSTSSDKPHHNLLNLKLNEATRVADILLKT
ncbi:mitochondrial fission ELM1 family protein [Acinetobacter sp. C_4_1]|uniref:mitochondrial fission ELM1 family protein n=1 Tax=unclassified Acinetobacter TaxID=196816 RepID=UPI0021B76181|nr:MULTISPECIES: mitochondrial fission ELM1 family protein [unclassified Acinetobacter]MCT8090193.1 mitochondrial fission ELM1 family protein [Acinetobacter sp. F_3_1]MCT8098669.1 mitochondrial fission ELM1 family protein [Acinetobacter sp. C_3_1]MCT8101741.1 mitochondrial fission ELM1 family protein [Acinetobacter sp. C_4_1]MCT8135563.1 mitochondrial fission ELM1 family protein [Acinetobacter sp. T_3_1]